MGISVLFTSSLQSRWAVRDPEMPTLGIAPKGDTGAGGTNPGGTSPAVPSMGVNCRIHAKHPLRPSATASAHEPHGTKAILQIFANTVVFPSRHICQENL